MNDPIPLVDLVAQHREIDNDVQADLRGVFNRAAFIGGSEVAAFEDEYARFCGVNHCVGVGNGTDAVEFALRACGVTRGGEVIIPANTFVATAEAVCRIGAKPVLVDVEKDTLLLDPAWVVGAMTPRTQAIVPVHLYGQLAPVAEVRELAQGLPIIEDAAQSQGATWNHQASGSLGDMAATSFYPGKNLGAAGDAGAVTTNNDQLALAVRLLGSHGSRTKYEHESVGFNSRLDAVQAVVLRHKLRRLQVWNSTRGIAANRYEAMLRDVPEVVLPTTRQGNTHVWHLYVVRIPRRDSVLDMLNEAGIGAALHYKTPLHLTRAFAGHFSGPRSFPNAEQAANEILSLPMFPHITQQQQERVVDVLCAALR